MNINIDKAFDTIMYKIENPLTCIEERLNLLDFLRDWSKFTDSPRISRRHKYKHKQEFNTYIKRLDYLARYKYDR